MSEPQQTTIDDQDLSKVKYTGNWLIGGGDAEYQGTVASSTHVGDFFTVSFRGNTIAVYGTIDSTSGGVQTNYSIDGNPPSQVTSQAGAGDTPRQLFWKSDILGVSDHILKVTMVSINPLKGGEGTIWFDSFVATDPTIREPPKKEHIGTIVGGVVGGIVGLLAIIVLLLLWRRRFNAVPHETSEKIGDHEDGELPVIDIRRISRPSRIQPFSLQADGIASRSHPSISTQVNELISRKEQLERYDSTPTNQGIRSPATSASSTDASTSSGTGSTQRLTKAAVAPLPLELDATGPGIDSSSDSAPGTIRHIDSGLRAVNLRAINIPSVVVELPPVYSPV